MGKWLQLNHLFLVVGVVLLGACALALLDGSVSSRLALRAFDQAQAEDQSQVSLQGEGPVDFGLWDAKRIREYKKSLAVQKQPPWAVLSIDKLALRVPVFEGTGELALNRGVGRIVGTAKPGEAGNIGIAGHRDGFFRGLKDIALGNEVVLTTLGEQATYVVDEIEIVSPEQVEVLRPRVSPSLTLVTCYPFYFIGDAPSRFIVHAKLDGPTTTRRAQLSSTSR